MRRLMRNITAGITACRMLTGLNATPSRDAENRVMLPWGMFETGC